jgi:hypothetical protein
MGLDVEAEVKQLVEEIKRLGGKGPDGKTSVSIRSISPLQLEWHPKDPRMLIPPTYRYVSLRAG